MKVKGIAIAIMPDFVKGKFGAEGLEKWMAAMPPESRDIFNGHILISKWYPLAEAYHLPTEALCRELYGGDLKGAWELGRHSAEYALKGVYKAFVKSPVVTVNVGHAGLMLPTYFQPATIDIKSLEERRAVLRITRFEGSTHHIEQRIGGWMERALEIAGAAGAKVEIARSLAHQDPHTEYLLTWS
ncbi:MAG TPA: hypothetical protein DDW31_00610 [candidate division Zixibacteria bacterium]|jgi:hypothetical protein|nr:hypothetical protein [candidate division Zixibacteria bacterium]